MAQFGEPGGVIVDETVRGRIPLVDVQKQIEAETEQTVSGAPTYHAGGTQQNSTLHTFVCQCNTRASKTTTITLYQRVRPSETIDDAYQIISVNPTFVEVGDRGNGLHISASGNTVTMTADSGVYLADGVTVTVSYLSNSRGIGSASYTCYGTFTSYEYVQWASDYSASVRGNTITVTLEGEYGYSRQTQLRIYYTTTSPSYYTGVTRTIDLGDDKFVTAVSVVSKSPSGATVTPTKTEHGASVYLYQNSSSTITATIKLEYYYYETVKEAKVKHNGTIYRHIKYNG